LIKPDMIMTVKIC